ncbi:hypothetical protein HK101_003384 [Irineochytrium annulatum]|nr:hypothetical protein HK101_003384 [Irineochytrium annulatum]
MRAGDISIVDDVVVNIFSLLDPNRRADRYTIYHCLFVSKPFFELAAERVWSSQRLPTSLQGASVFTSRFNVLLSHVLAHDPPAADDVDRLKDWRISVYLRSIRGLDCDGTEKCSDKPAPVPPHRLLPWLRKLDWVNASRADGAWPDALVKRLALPGQMPSHLTLSNSPTHGASALASLVGRGTRSLEFDHLSNERRRNFADVLAAINATDGSGWLEAIQIHGAYDDDDDDAIVKFLTTHKASVKVLGFWSLNLLDKITYALDAVDHLTSLRIGVWEGLGTVVSVLLSSSQFTLRELKVTSIRSAELVAALPLSKMKRLKSLVVEVGLLDKGIVDLRLGSLRSVTSLTVTANACEPLKVLEKLMDSVGKMKALEDLNITVQHTSENWLRVPLVGVPLQLDTKLRRVKFDLVINHPSEIWLHVVNTDGVKADGLPMLEEIEVKVRNYDRIYSDPKGRSFRKAMEHVLLDEKKTPALVYAHVTLSRTVVEAQRYQVGKYSLEWQGVGAALQSSRADAARIVWSGPWSEEEGRTR